MRLGLPALVVMSFLVVAPAGARAEDAPADLSPGNAAVQALLSALDRGIVADVVAALAPRVKVDGAVFADEACAKAFGGTRTVRGGKRTKLAECLIASWKAKASASEPVVAAAGKGWTATLDVGADRYVVALAAGKGGTARVAGITVNGGAPKPEPPKIAFFKAKNSKHFDAILEKSLTTELSKFLGPKGTAMGQGSGTGVGDDVGVGTSRKGKGTGGGGSAEGDFITKGSLGSGGSCPSGGTGTGVRDVAVAIGDAGGDFGGLTADEIQRVVKARAGIVRACYQRELNRTPGIAGKIVIEFVIAEDGTVSRTAVKSTTLNNEDVELCVQRQLQRMRFPAKGTRATVTYPFIFSSASG